MTLFSPVTSHADNWEVCIFLSDLPASSIFSVSFDVFTWIPYGHFRCVHTRTLGFLPLPCPTCPDPVSSSSQSVDTQVLKPQTQEPTLILLFASPLPHDSHLQVLTLHTSLSPDKSSSSRTHRRLQVCLWSPCPVSIQFSTAMAGHSSLWDVNDVLSLLHWKPSRGRPVRI